MTIKINTVYFFLSISDPQTPKWGLMSGTKKFLWLKQISDTTSLHPLPIAIGIGGLGVRNKE